MSANTQRRAQFGPHKSGNGAQRSGQFDANARTFRRPKRIPAPYKGWNCPKIIYLVNGGLGWGNTLNEYCILTRKGKSMACRIRFSFSVCSTCFNLTTFCLSNIFMAKYVPVCLCFTSITRPNEPVPRVLSRSKSSKHELF